MKVLVFDYEKFVTLTKGHKDSIPKSLFEAMKELDGERIRKYNVRSFARRVFGETHYIQLGDEKISINEAFSRWITIN